MQPLLSDSSDIDLTGIANDFILIYDSGSGTFKVSALSLDKSLVDLTDTAIVTETLNDHLVYNGTNW